MIHCNTIVISNFNDNPKNISQKFLKEKFWFWISETEIFLEANAEKSDQ